MIFGSNKSEDDTVVGLIAGALRRDISFGSLPPDGKLKIADLRARYGGSNHSIREALRLLTLYQKRLRSNLCHALRGRTDRPKDAADILAALIDGLYIRVALTKPDEAAEKTALALVAQLTGAVS